MQKSDICGLTGKIEGVKIYKKASDVIDFINETTRTEEINLQKMAKWTLNYLIETPKKDFNYEPVFQCHPLQCPPVPDNEDPVVPCDTDVRLNWEWYYMRDITGSQKGKEVEKAFHKRIKEYIAPDGKVWSHPGCYNENMTDEKYKKKDYVIHIWGATKILKGLAEDYLRTNDIESKKLAKKVMKTLKEIAIWDNNGYCWFTCGMGALNIDGTVVPNNWNKHPAPIIEPLVTYYLACKDEEGLEFAKAYAEGIMNNLQPEGIKFQPDGSVEGNPHSHATMHAAWGIAHLGVITGEERYINFVKKVWDWMLTKGTGTGWFPAMPSLDNCNETCHISDMMSNAVLIARGGYSKYFDYVERYMRNYISNLQFIITPQFKSYYKKLNEDATKKEIKKGLKELKKFQGGIIGGSGLNDYENELLGGVCGFEMFGCCAPEGMRAIYTTWSNTINRWPKSPLGPEGVYVNMSFNRKSKWGEVISFMPDFGRITVKAYVKDKFFIRPPHWVSRNEVRAFKNTKPIRVNWSGEYVKFVTDVDDEITITYPLLKFSQQVEGLWKDSAPDLKINFNWLGNMVVSCDPSTEKTPLFLGKPRSLPKPPK